MKTPRLSILKTDGIKEKKERKKKKEGRKKKGRGEGKKRPSKWILVMIFFVARSLRRCIGDKQSTCFSLSFADFTFVTGHPYGRNMGQTRDSASERSRCWQGSNGSLRREVILHPFCGFPPPHVRITCCISDLCLVRVTLDSADHLPLLARCTASACSTPVTSVPLTASTTSPTWSPASSAALSASKTTRVSLRRVPSWVPCVLSSFERLFL